MKTKSALRSFLALTGSTLLAISYAHSATTGFNLDTAGPHDYNLDSNWVSSTINGIWDSSLTLGADQTVTFGANTVLATGWAFNYDGNFGLTMRGTGANRTITLGGDISVNPVADQTITIGSGTSNQNLNVDLGGVTRSLTVNANKGLTLVNVLSNGGLTKSGAGTLTLSSNASTYSGQLTVAQGTLSIPSINNVSANGTLGNSNAFLPVILGSSGGNTGTLKYTAGSGSSTKPFTLATDGTGGIEVTTALSLQGMIDGGGNLTKTGAGTLTLFAGDGNYGIIPVPRFTGVTTVTGGKIKYSTSGFNFGDEYILFNSAYDTTGSTGGVGLDITGASNPWFGGLRGSENLATAITNGYTSVASVNLNTHSGDTHTYGGIIANGAATTALNKQGDGTQMFTNAQSYTGATTVKAGTLQLEGASGSILTSVVTVRGGTLVLDNSTTWTNRLADGTALSLGSLTLTSSNGAGINTESVGATTFAVGGKVAINDGTTGGDQTTLALGAATRSAGAAIDFVGTGGTLGAGADSPNVTSTGAFPSASNGILPWATVGGTQWAEDNANSIRAYSGSFVNPTSDPTDATANAQLSGSGSIGEAKSFNSLNVIATGAGQSLDLNGNLTLTSGNGAILKSGAEAYTLSATSGNITAGNQLITHVDGGALTISAPLNAAILNIAKGGTGNLILSGTRAGTISGAVGIADGQLEFQGNTTSLTGVISGKGGLTANLNAGQMLTISNTGNSYSGPTIAKGGILRIGTAYNAQGLPGGNSGQFGTSNLEINNAIVALPYFVSMGLGDRPGQFQITGGTAGFSASGNDATFNIMGDANYEVVWGSSFFNPSTLVLQEAAASPNAKLVWNNKIDLNGATRTIAVNHATTDTTSVTLNGAIRNSSGTAGLTKTGIGTLTLSGVNTYNGPTTVNQGTVLATSATALPGYNSAGGVVINGGTVAVRTGSGWSTAQVDSLLSNATKTSGNLAIDTTNGSLGQWAAFTAGNFGSLGLTKTGLNTLILDQANTYTGGTTISGGTLIFQKLVSMPASGVVAVQTGGTIGIGLGGGGEWTTGVSGEGTVGGLLAGLGGQSGSTVSYTGNVGLDLVTTGTQSYGAIANVGGSLALTKSGYGSLALSDTNTYTGATTLSGGTLVLDYDTTDNTKLANGAALVLNTGTLSLKGGTHLELVSSTSLNAGHTAITRDGGVTAKLRMNALNRAAGGTISFADATIADTDRTNTAGGIIGGYATLGNDWAVNSTNAADGPVTALASYTGGLPTSGGANTDNHTLSGDQTQAGAAAANTVRIANSGNSQTLDLGGNNLTITSTNAATLGGIMYVGGNDNNYAITGTTGRIVPSSRNQEIVFAVNTGTLSVSAFVGANNSSSAVTKFGAGTLVLSAANSNSGATRVNEGTLALGANNVFRDNSPFSIGNATLDADTYDDTVGTLDVTDNATINLGAGANLAFAASSAVDWTGGTLNLTGTLGSWRRRHFLAALRHQQQRPDRHPTRQHFSNRIHQLRLGWQRLPHRRCRCRRRHLRRLDRRIQCRWSDRSQ